MRSPAVVYSFACIVLLGCAAGEDDPASSVEAGGSSGTSSTAGGNVTTGSGARVGGSAGAAAPATGGSGGSPAGAGGSGGSTVGTGGSGGSAVGAGGNKPFTPPSCAAGYNATLPSTAPQLSTTEWTNISPKQVPFGMGMTYSTKPMTQGMTLDPCNPTTVYVCIGDGNSGVYRSTDGGGTWTMLGDFGFPIHVLVDPSDPLHLYVNDGVRGRNFGFWVSTDGGKSFQKPPAWDALAKTEKMFIDDTYDIAADPTDFKHVLVSFHSAWGWTDTKWNTSAGVLESKDGGTSWIVHPPMAGWGAGHAINFLYRPELGIGDSKTWLLGTQGPGMWRTTDAGATWTKVSDTGIQHGGGTMYYSPDSVLYASSASHVLKSTNNGMSFTPIGPNIAILGVGGDGVRLYTGPAFNSRFTTALLKNDTQWTEFNSQQFELGPWEMGFDPVNKIVYSANDAAGVWALKVK